MSTINKLLVIAVGLVVLMVALSSCESRYIDSPGGGYDWAIEYRLRVKEIERHLSVIDAVTDYDLWLDLTSEHERLVKKLLENGYEL